MFWKSKPPSPPPDPPHQLRWSLKEGLSAVGVPAIAAALIMFVVVVGCVTAVMIFAPNIIASVVEAWRPIS